MRTLSPPALVTLRVSYHSKKNQWGNPDVCLKMSIGLQRHETQLPACCKDKRGRKAGIIMRDGGRATSLCHVDAKSLCLMGLTHGFRENIL